jgi:UDP-N-acetylmuramoyl-L-alanyl-D-glutamate--2,6-diaminopimelate ligase
VIADDILQGLRPTDAKWTVELDRARAIEYALDDAREGDVIVLAGKGHEDYQETNGERIAFSDRAVVADTLARRGAR